MQLGRKPAKVAPVRRRGFYFYAKLIEDRIEYAQGGRSTGSAIRAPGPALAAVRQVTMR
jgi:hypothetical protein